MDYRKHFDEKLINDEMNKHDGLTYLKAKKIIDEWKKNNKEKYEIEFDDYADEINQFKQE